jgi:hypothetical protein
MIEDKHIDALTSRTPEGLDSYRKFGPPLSPHPFLLPPSNSFTGPSSFPLQTGNKNAYKALIAAEYVGVSIELPPFQMGVDNKTDEFLKMNPHGKVPVMSTPEGAIFEVRLSRRRELEERINPVTLSSSMTYKCMSHLYSAASWNSPTRSRGTWRASPPRPRCWAPRPTRPRRSSSGSTSPRARSTVSILPFISVHSACTFTWFFMFLPSLPLSFLPSYSDFT